MFATLSSCVEPCGVHLSLKQKKIWFSPYLHQLAAARPAPVVNGACPKARTRCGARAGSRRLLPQPRQPPCSLAAAAPTSMAARAQRQRHQLDWSGENRSECGSRRRLGCRRPSRPQPRQGPSSLLPHRGKAEDAASPAPGRGAAFRHAPRTPCIAGVADLIQVQPALAAVARGGGARNRCIERAATRFLPDLGEGWSTAVNFVELRGNGDGRRGAAACCWLGGRERNQDEMLTTGLHVQ